MVLIAAQRESLISTKRRILSGRNLGIGSRRNERIASRRNERIDSRRHERIGPRRGLLRSRRTGVPSGSVSHDGCVRTPGPAVNRDNETMRLKSYRNSTKQKTADV